MFDGNDPGQCQRFETVGGATGQRIWIELLTTPVLNKVHAGDDSYRVEIVDWAWNQSVDLPDSIVAWTGELDTDTEKIEPRTRPLIFNPCKGHAQNVRNIHNPEFFETLRELAALDGAFVVDNRGVVVGAGVYLDAPATKDVKVRRGLGSRHVAAAAITAGASALAVVISESSGSITVFAKGAALLELEKPPSS